MDRDTLFDIGPGVEGRQAEPLPPRVGAKRLRVAVWNQVEFQACALDELLPEDHEARIVWAYVCSLDLSELYERSGFVPLWVNFPKSLKAGRRKSARRPAPRPRTPTPA